MMEDVHPPTLPAFFRAGFYVSIKLLASAPEIAVVSSHYRVIWKLAPTSFASGKCPSNV
jgi:hypothetical protein